MSRTSQRRDLKTFGQAKGPRIYVLSVRSAASSACACRAPNAANRGGAANATTGPSLMRHIDARREAERVLGEREWRLLSCYGKLMDGPLAGTYVSSLAGEEQLKLVRRLQSGETVPVHLMHRHRYGVHRASSLRWAPSGLVMVFSDREVPAWHCAAG